MNNFPIFEQFFNHIFRKMICLFNLKMRKLAVSKISRQTESLVIHQYCVRKKFDGYVTFILIELFLFHFFKFYRHFLFYFLILCAEHRNQILLQRTKISLYNLLTIFIHLSNLYMICLIFYCKLLLNNLILKHVDRINNSSYN